MPENINPDHGGNQAVGNNPLDSADILMNAPIGIFASTPEGRFIYVNPALAKMYGYETPEEVIRTITDIGKQLYKNPADRERFMQNLATRGEVVNFEYPLRRRDGSDFWVSTNARVIRDETGKITHYQGFAQDINARKRVEQQQEQTLEELNLRTKEQQALLAALEASEKKYRFLTEHMNDIVWTTDLQMNITYISPSTQKVLGFTVEERMKQSLSERMPPVAVQAASKRLIEELENDQTRDPDRVISLDLDFYHKDGSLRTLGSMLRFIRDDADKPIGIYGVSRDISERRTAERELEEREFLLNKIFDVLPVGLWFADENGKLLRGNPAGIRIWGAEPTVPIEEYGIFRARRLPSRQEIAPEDWALAHTIKKGVTVKDELLEIDAFDGEKRIILNYTAPVLDNDGNVLGAIVVNNDITDRIRAEEDREKLQAQLFQSQKMESVGRLAGGVAHDFNNMLTIINGYAEMMADVLPPSDPMYESVQEIRDAGRRSSIVVRKLLAFARKQTIAPVSMNLNDSIANMLKMLQRLIGENIDLLWRPGKNLRLVKMDFSQIDQILVNLVVNARDAIADVGRLTIETKNVELDEAYCAIHPGFVPGRYVMLAVSDNGCGMDSHVLDNLFEPFFTTKEVGKGTGLGLPTVYGIVKQNNGFINVYSEPEKGTTFRIYLPCGLSDMADANTGERKEEYLAGNGEVILILEDEVEVLGVAKVMLERLGYTVLKSSTPNEAMTIAETRKGKIDLLITDIVMPEMNGREFSNQLNSFYPDIKTLYMSGYTANVIAHHNVLDEGLYFIEKPFSSKKLAAKVREVLSAA